MNTTEKAVKEILKKIINNSDDIPYEAKEDLKCIIDLEHDPESLLTHCLLYSLSYKTNRIY